MTTFVALHCPTSSELLPLPMQRALLAEGVVTETGTHHPLPWLLLLLL